MVSLNLMICNQKLQVHGLDVLWFCDFSSSLYAGKNDMCCLIAFGGMR